MICKRFRIIWQKAYIRLLVCVFMLLVIVGNILLTAIFNNGHIEEENRLMNELLVIESLLDERMAVVNKNFKLMRNWIESEIEEGSYTNDYKMYFVYNEDLDISMLKENPYTKKGNIVYKGHYDTIKEEDYLIMSTLVKGFGLQEAIYDVNEYDFWTAYYSDRYIIMYPWEDVVNSLGNTEELFQGLEASMIGLAENLDETLIKEGWENGVFLDASGEMLMVQKGLPVQKNNQLIGMLSSNTYIDIVHSWMSEQSAEGRLIIIDDVGMLVYDSDNEVQDVIHYSEVFDESEADSIEFSMVEDGWYTEDGYHYFTQKLEETSWTMLHQVPNELIEGKLTNRIVIYGICNIGVIILALISLLLAVQKVMDEQALMKQKDEFVMMVSHDLKTPLASIIGFTDLIKERFTLKVLPELDTNLVSNQKNADRILRNLGIIKEEGERLNHSIKNILDLAKMNSGTLMLIKETFDLEEMLSDIVRKLKPFSNDKGLEIILEGTSTCQVYGDRYYIYQLFINLIENAVKYTDEGYVKTIFQEVDGQIKVDVVDTGIGIHHNMIERVREPFVREEKAKEKSGNGLGLTICHRIVEEHNGILKIHRGNHGGTIVTVILPKEDKR